MSARHFLIVVAIVQGGLLAALIVLIILNRWFRLRRSTRLNPRREAIDASMRRWAVGTAPLAGVLVGLSRLPVPLAIDAIVKWSARVPGERWRQLALALEHTWWAKLVRANSTSARWWKRLESPRFPSRPWRVSSGWKTPRSHWPRWIACRSSHQPFRRTTPRCCCVRGRSL